MWPNPVLWRQHQLTAAVTVMRAVVLLSVVIVCGGCGEFESVKGQRRFSEKTLVTRERLPSAPMANEEQTNDLRLKRKGRTLEMSFLHEDHFAVALIDAVQIFQNPDLQEFNWNRFTKLLISYVGRKNAHPKELSAVWILCDREIADANKAEEAKESDFVVFVIEYLEPFDQRELEKAIKTRAESQENVKDERWRSKVVIRSDRQIAIGTPAMLKKLSTARGNGSVAKAISKVAPDVDVALSMSFEPVRESLKGAMAMVTQFLGDDMKPLLQLPTAARQFDATLSLSSKQLLLTNLEMNSSDSAKQVTEVWAKLLDSGNIGQLLTLFSFNYSNQTRMFEFRSLPVLNRISRQIEASGLYQVSSNNETIKSEFSRPRDFGEFLEKAVDDVERSLAVLFRMKRLREVAQALQKYEKIHGHLPAPNYRIKGVENAPRFSWRCEVLPLLGRDIIFKKIDFSLPWDGKVNKGAQPYICPPLYDRRDPDSMAVVLPVNPAWAFANRDDPGKLERITDRFDQTAIAFESRVEKPFHYFQPTDLTVDGLSFLGQEDERGLLFIDAEFKIRVVVKSEENLNAILSAKGGERLRRSDFIEVLGYSD